MEVYKYMEENNNKSRQIYNYFTKSYREKFAHIINHNDVRHTSCYCSECHNHLGDFTYESTYFAHLESRNIPTAVLEDIMPPVPGPYVFEAECKVCGKTTTHYTVDYGLGPTIQKLNKLGFATIFCCEGHDYSFNTGFDSPYIAFIKDYSEYFNMDDFLLRYWTIEFNEYDYSPCKMILRISDEAPMRYVTDNIFIKDLNKYINKVLSKKVGDKENDV
jgi:hypothetical protein